MTRLDQALVTRGFVRSRAMAKSLLDEGRVRVNGASAVKASTQISDDDELRIEGELDHYVGRAAHKLLAAIDAFPEFAEAIPGANAIDVGASTGGFTQVLLERGAAHVVALDVGHGQLAKPLRSEARVSDLEGMNIRDVTSAGCVERSPFHVVVSDLSFISLRLALPHMRYLLAENGHMVTLIKPQFEVGRERLGRTGVVSSREQRAESIRGVVAVARDVGLGIHGLAWSPMVGSHGNHEYLLWTRVNGQSAELPDVLLEQKIAELTHEQVEL